MTFLSFLHFILFYCCPGFGIGLKTLLRNRSSYLDIAVVVASVTTVARVHQNSVEAVHYRVAWALRHVGSDVQEFWVTNILQKIWQKHEITEKWENTFKQPIAGECFVNLCYFSSAEVGKPLQREGQYIRCSMDCEAFGRWHFLFAPGQKKRKKSHDTSSKMDL